MLWKYYITWNFGIRINEQMKCKLHSLIILKCSLKLNKFVLNLIPKNPLKSAKWTYPSLARAIVWEKISGLWKKGKNNFSVLFAKGLPFLFYYSTICWQEGKYKTP